MKELLKNIFLAPIPLPGSPLKELNSYFIKGDEKSLVIDVGFNSDLGEQTFYEILESLHIPINKLDVFLTHHHADHVGLIERLKNNCGEVFLSKLESWYVNNNFFDKFWEDSMSLQLQMGFPPDKRIHYTEHPAYAQGTKTFLNFTETKEGDLLEYGGYKFTVINLSGHTPEQIGLYEKENGILFCGDHILNKITPNIVTWNFEEDYLGLFLQNLKKVKDLNVKYLFSAHRILVENPNERIDQLIAHHNKRMADSLEILKKRGQLTCYEVAGDLIWDFGNGIFKDFPPAQKLFATSEVIAHLEHLKHLGKVTLEIGDDGVHFYKIV